MKYRIEHIRFIAGQGISYNATIDSTDTRLNDDQLEEHFGYFCEGDDWLEQIDNETGEVIATTEPRV